MLDVQKHSVSMLDVRMRDVEELGVRGTGCHKELDCFTCHKSWMSQSWISQSWMSQRAGHHKSWTLQRAGRNKSWTSHELDVTEAGCLKLVVTKLDVTKAGCHKGRMSQSWLSQSWMSQSWLSLCRNLLNISPVPH